MKNLALKNFGVQEMNTAEMSKIEGGGIINDLVTGLFNEVVSITTNFVKSTVSFIGSTLGTIFGSL
ncbi:hypothetical protein [Pedobacter sp. UYP1]|jgi:hypothetical protein|uniref:hypothetical protein n=1 Tax=Pedobacter sp. UYP1 TaxID=1756396 RepID=UPI003391BD82